MAYLLKILSRRSHSSASSYHLFLCKRTLSQNSSQIVFSEEVREAKIKNKPIVALESTIITHGMPYPANLETAMQVENIIRERVIINKYLLSYFND